MSSESSLGELVSESCHDSSVSRKRWCIAKKPDYGVWGSGMDADDAAALQEQGEQFSGAALRVKVDPLSCLKQFNYSVASRGDEVFISEEAAGRETSWEFHPDFRDQVAGSPCCCSDAGEGLVCVHSCTSNDLLDLPATVAALIRIVNRRLVVIMNSLVEVFDIVTSWSVAQDIGLVHE